MTTASTPGSRAAREPRWDLRALYRGLDDPQLESDLDHSLAWALDFRQRLSGRMAELDATALARAVEELEAISELVGRYTAFAELLHAADARPPAHGALLSRVQTRASEVRQALLFFELEWIRLPENQSQALLADDALARYRHFLRRLLHYRPHVLSEAEERILEEKANTGARAFARLFDEELSLSTFRVRHDGGERELTESEVLALLYEPDRELRRAAAEGLSRGLEQQARRLAYIWNVLVQDHASDDRLRGYSDPMQARHLANEVSATVVNTLLSTCEQHYELAQRYYRLKQRLLGLDTLFDYDRYAPVAAALPSADWEQAKRTVLSAFARFSPTMADIARRFFEGQWIDAEPRPGKRGGAFSSATVPSAHPFVLLNFTGRLHDVMTLAHELGHGVHQYLARKQGYLQMDSPLTLAETASVFGEMLVFQSLKAELETPAQRLALLCHKLEDTIATVFRQVTLTRFEQRVHAEYRQQGELAPERLSELWQEENARLYGDAVRLSEGYRWWWSYIPHFVHTPFYCYAYAFGELVVLSLFELYQQQGSDFVPQYLALLERGGSASPDELLEPFGIRLEQPDCWRLGLRPLQRLLAEAEELAAAVMGG